MIKSLPPQYNIIISFDSLHDGFGDRKDQTVAQILTPRIMQIIVSNGTVTSAVTDEV